MDFESTIEKARRERPYLEDRESTRVFVAGSSESKQTSSIFKQLDRWAQESGGKGHVIRAGSFGYYDLEPIVVVEKPGRVPLLYAGVTDDIILQVERDYLKGGNPRTDLAFCSMSSEAVEGVSRASELPLFSLQKRISLRNCGLTDPDDIGHYIAARHGYEGLSQALQMERSGVVEELRGSRLRGRGGEGSTTAEKWEAVLDAPGQEKVVVCNGVDGDSRSRTAQLLLGSDPHTVLEGLLIAAYGVGASRGILCVAEGSDAIIERLGRLFEQMRGYGLLGKNILSSGFDCEVEIRKIAPSLVAWEETAVLQGLDGEQLMPYLRTGGRTRTHLGGKAVLAHHIETLANVAPIFERGALWFSSVGTAASAGAKVVTLSGDVLHQYTVEVPFGTKIETIISSIGGGVSCDGPLKAVQFGGPTGGYFGPDELSIAVDYDGLQATGSSIGTGTLDVVAGHVCAVEMTEKLMSFVQRQVCGKCVFCREGTLQIVDVLKDIIQAEGKVQDIDLLLELGEAMKMGSICGVGRSAANPVASSIRLFRREYEAHIREKRCPWENESETRKPKS
jgi:NADH-quinone oxidoreductase subunit F